LAELTDNAIQALESGSDEHALVKPQTTSLPLPHRAFLSLADRYEQAGAISDLRREATTLVERLVRLLAIRLSEAQGVRKTVSATTGHSGAGKVAIIPK
jgi:hypothetical protein